MNINLNQFDGETTQSWDYALTEMQHNDHGVLVEKLVRGGIDINTKSTYGCTALMLAARSSVQATSRIIRLGADIDMVSNNDGWTALMFAAATDSVAYVGMEGCDIVSILLEHRANNNIKSSNGLTALKIAESQHFPNTCTLKIIEILASL